MIFKSSVFPSLEMVYVIHPIKLSDSRKFFARCDRCHKELSSCLC